MVATRTVTLAEKLGTTPHLSALLHRARRVGLDDSGLRRLAVHRGCHHYSTGEQSPLTAEQEAAFTDEELAIALLSPCWPYEPHNLRLGAAMVGAEGNAPDTLSLLARQERCETVLRQIAQAGLGFEPELPFWRRLLEQLPARSVPPGVLPHPTRYVTMTGFTRQGRGLVTEWQRPRRR
jgi:hypothetical protein